MISHVPGPFERLMTRIGNRYVQWLEGLCADEPGPRGGLVVQPGPEVHPTTLPPLRGLPALIARALETGTVDGLSQREIARRFNTSKSTVQRAQRLVREMA